MKIHYSTSYDSDIFLGDSPQMMGEIYVGNNGLLDQLQLRVGRHLETKSDVEREADYYNAMLPHIKGTLFEKAASVDPFGVASKLMHWRDALIMTGWDGKCSDKDAVKLYILASIESDFHSAGNPDCWRIISDICHEETDICSHIESISIECPWDEIPYLIQKTILSLKEHKVEVLYTADQDSEASIHTDRIKYVDFEDINDAYEWFATVEELPKNTAVINRDNVLLNHTLYTWNKPQVHSSLVDSNPQLLQLFKLSMSIFSRPLNIQNLLSYLMLPMSPIPGKLRRQLSKLLLNTGGFGEKKLREDGEVRDEWEELIASYEFYGKDGNDSPQAKGIARAKKLPFLLPIRNNYDDGIQKSELTDYLANIKKWVLGQYAVDELPSERKAQLHELFSYIQSLETAIQSLPDILKYDDIETIMLQIYRPMNYSMQSAETGSSNVISDIRALASAPDTLIWLDCQDEQQEIDALDFLSKREMDYLSAQGCVIPDFAVHLRTCRNERLRMLAKCNDIILVRSKFNGTKRLGEHSIIAEVRQAYKAKGLELQPTDPANIFHVRDLDKVTGTIERMHPVTYVELGAIDYPGRKESNSSLDTLINLPFNYLMQYVARLPIPGEDQLSNTFVTTGLVAHSFFEHIITDAGTDLGKMRQLVNGEFDSRIENAIDATGLILRLPENASHLTVFRRQLKESILSLIDILEQNHWTPEGCEIEIPQRDADSLHLDTIGDFGARIDFLARQGDQYIIIDFKWSYSKKYGEKLEANTAIQLDLYREAVKKAYPGKQILGVGYYLMPKSQLVTTDFDEIAGTRLVKKIDSANNDILFDKIKNSYEFRIHELCQGHIEEAETMEVMPVQDGYYSKTETANLCPLSVEEKFTGRGKSRTLISAKKKSEQVFKPSKKITFEKADAEPCEIATSHSILKGRLK